MTEDQIRETFRYHVLGPDNIKVCEDIRVKMTETVVDIAAKLPDSWQRDEFIKLMVKAQMMANASIAVHSTEPSRAAPTDTAPF